jgi:hypothetical protein
MVGCAVANNVPRCDNGLLGNSKLLVCCQIYILLHRLFLMGESSINNIVSLTYLGITCC